jgi:hypothetical protein
MMQATALVGPKGAFAPKDAWVPFSEPELYCVVSKGLVPHSFPQRFFFFIFENRTIIVYESRDNSDPSLSIGRTTD